MNSPLDSQPSDPSHESERGRDPRPSSRPPDDAWRSTGGADGRSRDLLDGWLAVVADSQRLTHLLRAAADEASPGVRRELELVLQHLNRATGHDRTVPDDPRLLARLPVLIHAVRTNRPLSAVRSIAADASIEGQLSQGDGQDRLTGLYLLAVFGSAWGVAVFVSQWILPTFDQMFRGFGAELPAVTLVLLRVGAILSSPVTQVAAVVVLVGWCWVWWSPRSRVGMRIRALAPDLGQVARARTWSRSSENLALLIEAGYDWPTARRLAWLAASCAEQRRVSQPTTLPGGVAAEAALAEPDSWVTPTSHWTETLDRPTDVQVDVLRTMSVIYGNLATDRRNLVTSSMGPLGIALIGLMVGITVIGLFAPFVSLISSLS